jgi:hypothetical protein
MTGTPPLGTDGKPPEGVPPFGCCENPPDDIAPPLFSKA